MGRRRKQGARYPSGRLRPAPKPTANPITGAEWQRIRQHALKLGADPRLITELGRLNLFGELTAAQTTAGHRVAEIYGRFERMNGLRRSVRSPSYERAFGISLTGDPEAERAAHDAYLALQAALEQVAPAPLRRKHYLVDALETLCVENRPIGASLYPEIRSLLQNLAERWQISTVKRRHAGAAQAPATKAAAAPPVPKINADRASWLRVMAALRPDLGLSEIERAYDLARALKDRADLLCAKRKPEATSNPGVKVTLDRPLLTLTQGDDDVA